MDFKHVLIIDDSSTSRMIIQRCLEMAGYEVGEFHYAENGLDALALLKGPTTMDLILTDINMPKMDGPTFVRKLKKEQTTGVALVLVISSVADSVVEAELRSNGVSGIIKKPVSPAKLREALGD
jgi:two-component system, chemotaxis family, chemotaxis protein CheY